MNDNILAEQHSELDQQIAALPQVPTSEHMSEEAFYSALSDAYAARVELLIKFIESCSGALAYCGRTRDQQKVLEACSI